LFQIPRVVSDQVYELLREKILIQGILPGERLTEAKVTKMLKVSRTPIREAFRRLEQDALVDRIPQGGVRVTEISTKTLGEVIAIRGLLEAYAGELACERVTPEIVETLTGIWRQAKAIIDQQEFDPQTDLIELSNLNTRFHDTVCMASESEFLYRILQIVRLPILRCRPLSLLDEAHRRRGVKEHKRMIELIQLGDKLEIRRLIIKHVEDVGQVVMRALNDADNSTLHSR